MQQLKDPMLILISSLILHDHFRPSTIGQAIVIAALSAVYGYNTYLNSKKEVPINDEIKKQVEEMRQMMNSLKLTKVFGR